MAGEKVGSTIANALTFPCQEAPSPGKPLIVGPGGMVSQTGVTGHGIADGAVGAKHFDRATLDLGLAEDGEITLDGRTSSVASLVSTTYTLTQDVDASTFHIAAGYTLRTAGYRIISRIAHLHGSAIIHNDGYAGNSATGRTGASKPGTATGVTLGSAAAAGNGGAGGSAASNNDAAGDAGSSVTIGLGGAGGNGGTGGTASGIGANTGSAGGSGGSITLSAQASTRTRDNLLRLAQGASMIGGGAGGGGGGGGGSNDASDGGAGGSGGSGGGVVLLAFDTLNLHSWTGRISANGGDGGDGWDTSNIAGDGGGGGGGGGGFVQVVYRLLVGGTLTSGSNVTVSAGNGGAGPSSGINGAAGSVGTVRIVQTGVAYVPASEIPFRAPAPRPFYPRPRLHAGHYIAMQRRNPLD